MTAAETKLWKYHLRYHPLTFHRQHPIDHYIVDFYNSQFRLVIELDGEQHYTPEGKEYDQQRDSILSGYGLNVLRFSNVLIMENFDEVVRVIEENLKD